MVASFVTHQSSSNLHTAVEVTGLLTACSLHTQLSTAPIAMGSAGPRPVNGLDVCGPGLHVGGDDWLALQACTPTVNTVPPPSLMSAQNVVESQLPQHMNGTAAPVDDRIAPGVRPGVPVATPGPLSPG